jgi:hypothetical protein
VDGNGFAEIVDGTLEIAQAEFGDTPQEIGLKSIRLGVDGHIKLLDGLGVVFLLQVHLAVEKEMLIIDLSPDGQKKEQKQDDKDMTRCQSVLQLSVSFFETSKIAEN